MTDKLVFPIGASITLADLEGDPNPTLHELRSSEPVSWLPILDAWLITQHDLATAVMRNASTFTVDHPGFSTAQVVGPSMLSLDGDNHVQHRSPFERPFRKNRVEARFKEAVAQLTGDLIGGLIRNGRAELRRDFAGPVAAKVMILALGLEDFPVSQVLELYDAIVDAVTLVTAGEPVSRSGEAAYTALQELLLPILRGPPDASLLAAAAGSAHGLSEEQILSNAAVLLFGGIETTEGMIANALYFLLTEPSVLDNARRDSSMLPSIVEESLRLEPAAAVVDRYAVSDTRLGGALIGQGDLVRVSLSGANRDPAIFNDPDRFDPSRVNLHSHVAFAQGPHVCLGLHLARLETLLALEQIVQRLPNLRLDETDSAIEAARPSGLIFRKPRALHAVWEI